MKNTIHMLASVEDTICNSFLIATQDGKVIAVDGGHRAEAGYFLSYLKENFGCRIDAWFLSHPHNDHVETFYEIIEKHPEVSVGHVYVNYPSAEFFRDESRESFEMVNEFHRLLPIFADRVTFPSGGDEFSVGAAKIKVLYSYDFEFRGVNNASLVFRMDLGGRSVLFTGDCGPEAGNKILRVWKDTGLLKCDICQMAHHGQNGCERGFYEAVSPDVCLWCTPSWLWTNDDGKGPYKTLEVRRWMEDLGVKENRVMKDGTLALEL